MQRAFMLGALGGDHPLIGQIEYGDSAVTFIPNMKRRVETYDPALMDRMSELNIPTWNVVVRCWSRSDKSGMAEFVAQHSPEQLDILEPVVEGVITQHPADHIEGERQCLADLRRSL